MRITRIARLGTGEVLFYLQGIEQPIILRVGESVVHRYTEVDQRIELVVQGLPVRVIALSSNRCL